MNKFAYTNEEDKSYGLAGMAISMQVWDKNGMLREISLDAPIGSSITFTPDFYFSSNPRFSAKLAWNEMIKQYQILMGLVIGNILCRRTVLQHLDIDQALVDDIYAIVEDEGRNDCALDDDEIHMIYRKTFSYLANLYANRQLASAIKTFVADLRQRRKMSGAEVEEELRYLNL